MLARTATWPASLEKSNLEQAKVKRFLLATALALSSCFALAQSAQVLELASRPGVTQQVLMDTPAGPPTQATLVLLMGGNGQLGIYPNGSLRRDTHFLARVRGLLTARGHATLLVDAPSDRRDLDGNFREVRSMRQTLARSSPIRARLSVGRYGWSATAAVRIRP